MLKKSSMIFIVMTCAFFLSGCITDVWTGVSLVYARHDVYKKINDFQLGANANRALYKDSLFKQKECSLEVAVFHGDLLLVGRVPTEALRQTAVERVRSLNGYRRFFNQIEVSSHGDDTLQDHWITAKIRSNIFMDSDIDPKAFKVVTFGHIVYLMGDVISSDASRVIQIARSSVGVKRVVVLFQYYNLVHRRGI